MIAAVIVAAGQGLRMGAARRKQYLQLSDQPILVHTLRAFDGTDLMNRLVLVVPQTEMDFCDAEIVGPARLQTPVHLIPGGRRRQDSVYNGLASIEGREALVLVHDGVRPLVSRSLIAACIDGANRHGACIPAVPVIDTLKRIDPADCVQATVSRKGLYAAQTPQAFKLSLIRSAHEAARRSGQSFTDDASLVEALGHPVKMIPGERRNIKITTSEDLELARAVLEIRGHTAS